MALRRFDANKLGGCLVDNVELDVIEISLIRRSLSAYIGGLAVLLSSLPVVDDAAAGVLADHAAAVQLLEKLDEVRGPGWSIVASRRSG